jgi:hypothetical protein
MYIANVDYHVLQLDGPGTACRIKGIRHPDPSDPSDKEQHMNSIGNTASQQTGSSFSFAALVAALFQLKLRDKLSASNHDDGAHTWGL